MAQNDGTLIVAPIRPYDSADRYPTHEDQYGKGGYRVVADITARDAITDDRRSVGMRVHVISTARDYRLVGGTANANWVEVGTDGDDTLREDLASEVADKGASLVALEQGGTVQDAVKWVTPQMFGAVGDGVTDDYAAFAAATAYCEANGVWDLVIPPGDYHLSEPWAAPSGGNFASSTVNGYGATLDNSVIVKNTTGINSLTIDGSPDCGFVFTRGQGAVHSYLIARNCAAHGFYFGIASRQHVTVGDSSGFRVGEVVTGGTSGKFGTIERIDGNVLRLVKCNLGNTPGFFQASETVTGGTSSASSTVTAVATPYGQNYQVTRATFSGLTATGNSGCGFYWDGTARSNRSFMNATMWLSPASVSNTLEGWFADSAFSAPGGNSQHNYNTFVNINSENNLGQSLIDVAGTQNTFVGGHFVDPGSGGESFTATGGANFQIGGRVVGPSTLVGPLRVVNSSIGPTVGQLLSIDNFQSDNGEITGPPFFPVGWSILPAALVTQTIAGDNQAGHLITIDMSDFIGGDYISLRLTLSGFRNQSSGYTTIDNAQVNISMCSRAGSTTEHAVTHSVAATEGITVNSVTVSPEGIITVNLDTTGLIFTFHRIVEYYSSDGTDPRGL